MQLTDRLYLIDENASKHLESKNRIKVERLLPRGTDDQVVLNLSKSIGATIITKDRGLVLRAVANSAILCIS